jgi:hypothetical protein
MKQNDLGKSLYPRAHLLYIYIHTAWETCADQIQTVGSLCSQVEERDVQRNYGFVVATLDEREYILSAVTHGIRNNWINALKSAANISSLPEPDNIDTSVPTKLAKEGAAPSPMALDAVASTVELKSLSRRNTADNIILSTSTGTQSPSFLKAVDAGSTANTRLRSESGGSGGIITPISPPLTRTPTSRVKKEKGGSLRLGGGSGSSNSSSSRGLLQGKGGCDPAAVSGLSGQGSEKAAAGLASLLIREEILETRMIPERDTGKLGFISRFVADIRFLSASKSLNLKFLEKLVMQKDHPRHSFS